jgi:hypothetical protein
MILRLVGLVVVALGFVGCGAQDVGGSAGEDGADASAASLVGKCSDRLVARTETDVDGLSDAEREAVRGYVETTYCARFVERGWVYEDGTLRIAAYEWSLASGDEECARSIDTGAATTVTAPMPALGVACVETDDEDSILDCALLHQVRRSEVRSYIEELRRRIPDVECDDGTPLEELGAQ